jgi:hypothetical protein
VHVKAFPQGSNLRGVKPFVTTEGGNEDEGLHLATLAPYDGEVQRGGEGMNTSSKLTRIMMFEWLKQQWIVIAALPVAMALVALYSMNPIISGKQEIAIVVRNQQIPDKYNAATLITFIELPNGRNASFVLPNGMVPPAPGSSIRVMHSQHLLLGDSFQFIQ